jgi:hypothetical protein
VDFTWHEDPPESALSLPEAIDSEQRR